MHRWSFSVKSDSLGKGKTPPNKIRCDHFISLGFKDIRVTAKNSWSWPSGHAWKVINEFQWINHMRLGHHAWTRTFRYTLTKAQWSILEPQEPWVKTTSNTVSMTTRTNKASKHSTLIKCTSWQQIYSTISISLFYYMFTHNNCFDTYVKIVFSFLWFKKLLLFYYLRYLLGIVWQSVFH